MNNPSLADARALRATASACDAQRNKLPVPGAPHRSPDSVSVARQIAEFGKLITDLGTELFLRTASQGQDLPAAQVITGFASAVAPLGEAASALGEAAHQFAFLDQTKHLREQADARDAREAAVRVTNYALNAADTALREAAGTLHAAATTVSSSPARLRAARHRSMTAVPTPGPLPIASAPATATPPGRITRSR